MNLEKELEKLKSLMYKGKGLKLDEIKTYGVVSKEQKRE